MTRYRRLIQCLALILVGSGMYCLPPGFVPTPDPTSGYRREIYGLLLQRASPADSSARRWVLGLPTRFRPLPEGNWLRLGREVPPRELERALDRASRRQVAFAESDFPVPTRLLDRELAFSLADRGLGGTRVVGLTPVVFSRDLATALVYYEVHCGDLCGTGVELWLERGPNGSWRIRQELAHWYR